MACSAAHAAASRAPDLRAAVRRVSFVAPFSNSAFCMASGKGNV